MMTRETDEQRAKDGRRSSDEVDEQLLAKIPDDPAELLQWLQHHGGHLRQDLVNALVRIDRILTMADRS
jgi:hypothetical protein